MSGHRVHLGDVEGLLGVDDDRFGLLLTDPGDDDLVVALPREPRVGYLELSFAAPHADSAVRGTLVAASEAGDDVAGETQRGRGNLVHAALGANPGTALDLQRLGNLLSERRAGDQAGHGHGVAAEVHQAAAGGAVLQADIVQGEAHVAGEAGLDQAHRAHRAGLDKLDQFCGLGMAAVHEGFEQKYVVVARGLDERHRLTQVGGQRLLAEDVLAGLRRLDAPLGVEMVGQGVVDHVYVRVGEQRLVAPVPVGHVELGAERLGRLLPAATDGE